MSEVERRGTPAMAWTADTFAEDAKWSANVWGCPELAIVQVPECFTNNQPDLIRRMVDDATDAVIRAFTRPLDVANLNFSHITRVLDPELHYSGNDLLDCFDAMNRAFVEAHWSDGYPLVPPTRAKVDAMIAGSGLPGDHVVGLFEPGFGVGTVEKIAANAVMAGCRPEHMPILLAFAECWLDPRSGMRGVAMSTGPQAPVIMVSGPYAKEIGLNSGVCAIGPGSVSSVNVAIGRAARLMMMNVGLSYPGVSDMDTQGTTMKFTYCVAENEDRNPFEPHRVTRGFSLDSTTVTINSPFSATVVHDFENHDPNRLLAVIASCAKNAASPNSGYWLTNSPGPKNGPSVFAGDSDNLLLLCPDHAQVFARAGWTLRDIKHRLYELCRMPFQEAMLQRTMELFRYAHPHLRWLEDKPETEVSIYLHEDTLDVFVVGGDAGWSTWHDGGTYSITREVKL
ncbi:MAG: hypothetical protein AB7L13_09675 [Acidimicrobiia bacterium]